MKQGIEVQVTARILNISTNYVYRLVREDHLKAVSYDPLLISASPIRNRLMQLVPFLATDLAARTDYQIRQYEAAFRP